MQQQNTNTAWNKMMLRADVMLLHTDVMLLHTDVMLLHTDIMLLHTDVMLLPIHNCTQQRSIMVIRYMSAPTFRSHHILTLQICNQEPPKVKRDHPHSAPSEVEGVRIVIILFQISLKNRALKCILRGYFEGIF